MTTFIVALICLVAGYFIYGSFIERVFGADAKIKTPCYTSQDGVDYMPLPTWRVFIIQFLNIAGTGPIFGAIQGVLFGPAAYIWIVLGCIFGGAVHDYMLGMMSIRRHGESLPEIVGDEFGERSRLVIRVLALLLLILVSNVWITTPAGLLATMTSSWGIFGTLTFWIIVIFSYYIIATLLPIDKFIGRLYPLFGFALLAMAAGVLYGIFTSPGAMPEITEAFRNYHPSDSIPLFPGLCITIACGAVSGFHATQSPLMARCLKNEKYGRPVFYGAMITEGIVALIWAAATIKFADTLNCAGATPYEKLMNAMTENHAHGVNPVIVINQISTSWLGTMGAILAILGVVAAPITSGDTALRSARLIAVDFMHCGQDKISKRLMIAAPIFLCTILLTFVDFTIVWRYFAWVNQTLAAITLWAITLYLTRKNKTWIISYFPALFMTMVCSSYILIAPEGLQLPHDISYLIAGAVTIISGLQFLRWHNKRMKLQTKAEDCSQCPKTKGGADKEETAEQQRK